MVLGPRMAAARKAKGLTQKELAAKLDLVTGTVQQYELGKRRPDVETLKNIADILQVSVDSLVSTSEPEDEYELICDTLDNAGYKIEQGTVADEYYISPVYAEGADEVIKVEYSRLAEIVHRVLADAETNKAVYIQKRLEAELFWPKGWACEQPSNPED